MVTTERLIIIPLTDNEMQAKIDNEPNVDLKQAYSEMLDNCKKSPNQRVWYAMWVIKLKVINHTIGSLCFKGLNNGIAEIGYGIDSQYEGKGFMTEAVSAMAEWACNQSGVICVEAETEIDNIASQKVLAKSGFLPNGIFGEEGPRFVFTNNVTK